MKAKCVSKDWTLSIEVGETRDIIKNMNRGLEDQDNLIINLNEICYTSIDSNYFKKHFEVVEEEKVDEMEKENI
jgi:hypothetical protein